MYAPSFRFRRRISLCVTAIAMAVVVIYAWLQEGTLANASFFTGSTLLGSVLLLVLLGVRRRLPVLPLGSVSTWTQIHIYTGMFAAGVYIVHVPQLIGGGVFECGLSIMFWLVSASGCYGIYASRTLPKRLTAVEGQHRFDRVAWHRDQIAEKGRELLEQLHEGSAVRVLGSFYNSYLNPFFQSKPSFAYVLVPTGVRRRRLLSGLTELNRYLESSGQDTAGQFAALVRRRDDLDYQYALQLRLRLWLVIHGTLSVALVVGGIVHGVMAWRFAG